MEKVILSNMYEIPALCYGTDIISSDFFSSKKIKRVAKNVISFLGDKKVYSKYKHDVRLIRCTNKAWKEGCCFFDTSRAYGGAEDMLRRALAGVPRADYYVCTKLRNRDQLAGKTAKECLLESMSHLGVDYVDLYLLHWPVEGSYLEYWKQLEELYKEGLVKAIGVSNCKRHHLEEIERIADIMPMVDEVELHPLLTETELRQYCKEKNIRIMAYSSTARMDFRLCRSRRLGEICKETGRSLSQIILRWHIQNGVIPIFNTSSVEHLKENLNVWDFSLSDEQMRIIESININSRTRYDSDNCEWDCL